jgi:hypothetical protein
MGTHLVLILDDFEKLQDLFQMAQSRATVARLVALFSC